MSTITTYSRWLLLFVITLFASQSFGHGMSDAEKQAILDGGNLSYIWIGATHMLSGYDHLAFVFGIIFFLTRLKDIIKYVTAFTLGHSVTLIFATFNAIQINYFLIDAVIALSVCYIAFVNLNGFKKHLGINPPSMMVMITGFGLIHGLGLSTRLQQLPLNQDQLLLNIISFNVGIEIGQISALALMLMLIAAFRKSHNFPIFSKVANSTLIIAGGFLFLMQMHDYQHDGSSAAENTIESVLSNTTVDSNNWTDTITITIPARGDKEYKLQLENSATINYTWQTDGTALFFDFHAEPKGDTSGYFKSFNKDTRSHSSGSLTSSFAGTHGWYWKNNSALAVEITLRVKGDYQLAKHESTNTPKIILTTTHESID